jgi:large subunit ribosomal protein L29
MKMKELQNMNQNEIVQKLASLREQVRDLSFKIHSREVKNSHTLKSIKKDIARMLTLINKPALPKTASRGRK